MHSWSVDTAWISLLNVCLISFPFLSAFNQTPPLFAPTNNRHATRREWCIPWGARTAGIGTELKVNKGVS